MILLTMLEWVGPGKKMSVDENLQTESTEKIVMFATDMDINDALRKIKKYQEDFNNYYRYAVNFSLIGISETPLSISADLLEYFNVEMIEHLKSPGDD